jgi:hypothetical protein
MSLLSQVTCVLGHFALESIQRTDIEPLIWAKKVDDGLADLRKLHVRITKTQLQRTICKLVQRKARDGEAVTTVMVEARRMRMFLQLVQQAPAGVTEQWETLRFTEWHDKKLFTNAL